MKIHGAEPLGRLEDMLRKSEERDSAARVEEKRSNPASLRAGGRGTDEVAVSEQAKELGRLKRALDADPALRREVVDGIKQEISSGSYRVDSARITDGLLQEARILPELKGLDDGIAG